MRKKLRNNVNAVSAIIIALIILVIAAIAIGGASFILMQNTPSTPQSLSPSSSPAPSTISSPSPSTSPNSNVIKATSLQFTVTFTNSSGVETNRYVLQGKNLGNTASMMRIDWTYPNANGAPQEVISIVNGAQQKSWTYNNFTGTPIWVAAPADEYANSVSSLQFTWQSNLNYLENYWNGVDNVAVNVGASTVRVFDISLNPILPDSLFQP